LIEATDDLMVVGESGTVAGTISRIVTSRPDVAILDVRLPDGSGVEVGRDIQIQCPEVRCLMLTSSPDDEALVATAGAGAAGYLSKPISAVELLRAVRWVASGEQHPAVDAVGAGDRRRASQPPVL
jgi:two-component system response regulator DevR